MRRLAYVGYSSQVFFIGVSIRDDVMSCGCAFVGPNTNRYTMPVYSPDGDKVGTVVLPKELVGQPTPFLLGDGDGDSIEFDFRALAKSA